MDNIQNDFESKPVTQQPADDLHEQVESLRQTVFGLLVLMLVISGTLLIFLWRQYKLVDNDLKVLRPQLTQLVTEYEKSKAPAIKQFVDNLVNFSKTHPDFTPVLNKYGIRPTNAPAAAATSLAPTAAPAPTKTAPAAPAKK